MKLKDRLPKACIALALDCIDDNREGFDCWPPGAPKMWWCWATLLWRARIVVVVDTRSATWHLKIGSV